MEFGEWLQGFRKDQGLDVRSLAEITSVDSSTISRTENLHTQTTLFTAFRISEGVGISLVDLIEILEGKRLSSLESSNFIENGNVLTLQNIQGIIDDFSTERDSIAELIASHLNILLKETQSGRRREFLVDEPIAYKADDVYRFLYNSPLSFISNMKYPLHLEPGTILYTYEREGALMLRDVELYVSSFRHNKLHIRLPVSFPLSPLIGTGSSLERIKFSDILQFDIEAEQGGKVIGMYWEVCKFYAKFAFTQSNLTYKQSALFDSSERGRSYNVSPKESIIRLAVIVTAIYRWYQSLRGNEFVFKME